MSEDGISPGEQAAFCETHDLIARLRAETASDPVDIGKGALVAALACLREVLPSDDVATLFYEVADDYAVRDKCDE